MHSQYTELNYADYEYLSLRPGNDQKSSQFIV